MSLHLLTLPHKWIEVSLDLNRTAVKEFQSFSLQAELVNEKTWKDDAEKLVISGTNEPAKRGNECYISSRVIDCPPRHTKRSSLHNPKTKRRKMCQRSFFVGFVGSQTRAPHRNCISNRSGMRSALRFRSERILEFSMSPSDAAAAFYFALHKAHYRNNLLWQLNDDIRRICCDHYAC